MSVDRLRVVVPYHHRRDLLDQALASVARQDVMVVDDSPGGELGTEVQGVPVLRTHGEEGFARAANAGLARAEAEGVTHVLLLNDDAVLEAGAVEALVAAWGPGVGAVGPLVLDEAGEVSSAGFELRWWGRLRERRVPVRDTVEVDALSGACLLLPAGRRFDPAYRHGMEDVALGRELRAEGLRILLVGAARCHHVGGATVSRTSAEAQRHAVAGHLRLVGGGWRTPVVLGLALAQVVREGGPVGRLGAIAQGLRDHRSR